MYIISRCLLGVNCKYNGGNNLKEYVIEFCNGHSCTSVCPESVCLTAPRDPAEQITSEDGSFRVVDRSGRDLTVQFIEGSLQSVARAEKFAIERGEPIEGAILKANSPSCGCGKIYNGEFNGTLVDGNGVFAQLMLDEFESFKAGKRTLIPGAAFSPDFTIITEKDMQSEQQGEQDCK